MRVLLLDADRHAGRPLAARLRDCEVVAAHDVAQGLRLATSEPWSLILLDADFSAAGMELLGRLHSEGVGPIAFVTAQPSIELTLEAIRLGALDVLCKPLSAERVDEALSALGGARQSRPLPDGVEKREAILGTSPEMLNVFKAVARVASSDATVLVLGESGTGKELVARVLHAQSRRAKGPFIAINCAAIPENLLESELFGHEKGAFTGAIGRRIGRFERAIGGTLFLDEIGDMSIALQSKILRALQEREIERVGGSASVPIDVRVVAATNKDLGAAVEEGKFRDDLYYRLAVVSLSLPPLRQRGEDLDRLVEHFAALYAQEHQRPVRAIAEATLEVLRAHPWPGNVRQLRNVMERAVVMSSGRVILPQHLPPDIRSPDGAADTSGVFDGPLCTLAEMESRLIGRALRETGHNLTLTAERLGIHRNTLRRKMSEYGLAPR